jgi:hypothetical protein
VEQASGWRDREEARDPVDLPEGEVMDEKTLRDLFALAAMHALMNPQLMRNEEDVLDVPRVAYLVADQMMRERA